MVAGSSAKPARPVRRGATGCAMLAMPLLLMAAGCGSSPGGGSARESAKAGGPGERYCVSLGGRKLCFEQDDIYWPVEDKDYQRGLAALMPAFAFDDPECSQPASTVEDVRQFLIAEPRKGEDVRRWFEVDYEHYEPHLTTRFPDGDAGSLECRKVREGSPVPNRGFLCQGQTGPAAYTLVTCGGDDVPVPHCEHRTYADGLRVHMTYPRQCFPHWKKLESIPLAIIRDAATVAEKSGK